VGRGASCHRNTRGREAGLDFLRAFSAEIQASGLVNAATARAGLKGIMVSGK